MKLDSTIRGKLAESSLFFALSKEQLEQVLASAQVMSLESGDALFAQGDLADHFYYVSSGMVRLYRLSPNGEEKIIEVVYPGQTFAEALMFSGQQKFYPVNAEMVDAGCIVRVSSSQYKAILAESTDTCFSLLANFSQRLHRLVGEIDRLTLQTATDRVVNYLLQNQSPGEDRVILPISKQMLASQLSIKPETLSRTFKKLSQEGLIAMDGAQIDLLNIEALRDKVQV